jgi:hypothetical protein
MFPFCGEPHSLTVSPLDCRGGRRAAEIQGKSAEEVLDGEVEGYGGAGGLLPMADTLRADLPSWEVP